MVIVSSYEIIEHNKFMEIPNSQTAAIQNQANLNKKVVRMLAYGQAFQVKSSDEISTMRKLVLNSYYNDSGQLLKNGLSRRMQPC